MLILYARVRKTRSQQYALRPGEPKRLEIRWEYGFGTTIVMLDGKEIGRATSQAQVKEGMTVGLPDGSALLIKVGFDEGTQSVSPDVSLDGVPLPGSVKDPEMGLKHASRAFIFGAVINIFGGVLAFPLNPLWYSLGVNYFIGGVLAVVAGLMIKKRNRNGLRLGVFVACVYALTFLVNLLQPNEAMGFLGDLFDLLDTGIFAYGLYKGSKVKTWNQ